MSVRLGSFTPQLFLEVRDLRFGLLGYLAIDRTIGGRSCGGIRWGPEVSPEELAALSYSMTLKFGFANIPFGGAKSGIVAPFEAPPAERHARLEAFGRQLAPLLQTQLYIPGADLGTTHEDYLTVVSSAGMRIPDPHRGEHGGYFTGYGAIQAALVALKHLRLPVSGCRVAIEGFGKVGGTIGQLLAERGAKVVAIATKHGALHNSNGLDVKQLLGLRDPQDASWIDRYGDAVRLTPAELYTLPVDVLIPCAGPWVIHDGNVEQIQAAVVVSAANIPAIPAIQRRLEARGILYLPDFMCNCGGIFANTLQWRGFSRVEIERFFREVLAAKMEAVLAHARATGASPVAVAEAIALDNVERMQRATAQRLARSRFEQLQRALSQPHRSVRLAASTYYRSRRPLWQLAASAAWQEAVRAFQDGVPDGLNRSPAVLAGTTEVGS